MRTIRSAEPSKPRFIEQREAKNPEDFVKASLHPDFFLHDRHKYVDADFDPDLRLHRVVARAEKGFYAKPSVPMIGETPALSKLE